MTERSRTVQDAFGRNVEGRDVDISESTERFSELRLEDGTILRIKPSVLQVTRLVEQWDPEGNPIYVVRSQNLVLVSEAPAQLKRKSQ